MYLSESIVRDTLIKISQNFTSSDSVIGFDYINNEWANVYYIESYYYESSSTGTISICNVNQYR